MPLGWECGETMKTTKTIQLSAKEKKALETFVENKAIARAAFREASEMLRNSEHELWVETTKIHPHVLQIKHLGKIWSVVCRVDGGK